MDSRNTPAAGDWPSPRLVYHRQYNIGLFGLEKLHPFDSRKYGRAWKELYRRYGRRLHRFWVKPPRPISRAELLEVHDDKYLETLRQRQVLANLLEIPQLKHVPAWLTDRCVLRPMRWAVMGTVVGAREAVAHGLAINLSGGYHHASPADGHGFSAYADVGLAVNDLRKSGCLGPADRIVYVDLDAHQGNGVCRTFADDQRVFIYDQYNWCIFPGDIRARRRIDCDVPLDDGCPEAKYLASLKQRLPVFLDSLTRVDGVGLGIYNAGTDVYAGDRLGRLNVSAEGDSSEIVSSCMR